MSRYDSKHQNTKYNMSVLADCLDVDKLYSPGMTKATKLRFKCSVHGVYLQNYYNHLYAVRDGRIPCPKCSRSCGNVNRNIKNIIEYYHLTDEQVQEAVHPELLLASNASQHIEFRCLKNPNHPHYFQFIYNHYGERHSGCPTCAAQLGTYGSELENKLRDTLHSKGINCFKDRNLIAPYELDIYLPEYKLAIEVNGSYWHSDLHLDSKHSGLGKRYHLMKTQLCLDKGVQLLHFHYGELQYKWDICLNKILSLCGKLQREKVFARKCELVFPVASDEARLFYNKNHIQGFGQGICFGLKYQGDYVSMMSFKKCASNTREAGSWELNRYATAPECFVVGGFERLETAFIRMHHPTRLISFADRRLSSGSLYCKQGYTLESVSEPDYEIVTSDNKVHHKFNYRKSRFKTDPELEYKEGLTEFQLEDLNHLFRVYDCGLARYVKTF